MKKSIELLAASVLSRGRKKKINKREMSAIEQVELLHAQMQSEMIFKE